MRPSMPFLSYSHHVPSPLRAALLVPALSVVFALAGQTAQQYVATGDSLLALDKPQRALDQYEKALELEQTAVNYLARSRALYRLDRMDRFLLDVDKALRMDSTLAEAHYQRALYAMRAEDLEKVEYHTTRALAHTEENKLRSLALLLRGEARADLKRINPAIADLEAGMAVGTQEVELMQTLARLYDAAGRHAESLAVLEQLCELDPYQVGHWSNRAFELIMLERYNDALPMVEKALELDRDEPVALSNRAYILLSMGKEDAAWDDVERSLRSYPANPYALRTRAILRLRKGDRDKACDDLTLAKALADIAEVDELVKEHCGSTPK